MKSLGKNALPVIFLLIISVLFFIPYLATNSIPYAGDFTGSDLTELNLPLRFLAAEAIKIGQIPLWTDQLAGGFPLLAEGQAGVFYPFNLLTYPFLPFASAVNVSFFLNFFFASLFAYLYCRVLKISRFGAVFAALAFAFGGFFVFRIKHINLINAAIWLPLQLYLLERYFAGKRKANWLMALALVFAVQFFAGHPQISYIAALSCFAYFCLKLALDKQLSALNLPKKIILPWVILAIMILSLCAVQLLPTFFNSAVSGRGTEMNYGEIIVNPYPAVSLLYFFWPYYLGNPAAGTFPIKLDVFGIFWENNIYFGLLPLALALAAIWFLFPRNNSVKLLAILIGGAFLLAFGDFSQIFIILWKIIPGFQMFRFPQRFLLPALVGFCALAGFGFDLVWQRLLAWQEKNGGLARSTMLFKVLLPVFAIACVMADLYAVDSAYLGSLDYAKYFSPPQSAEFLRQDKSDFRILSLGWPQAWQSIYTLAGGWQNNMSLYIAGRELLPPNLNAFWGIASAADRGSLEGGMLAKESQILGNRLTAELISGQSDKGEIKVSEAALKALSLQNIKYLLSYQPLVNDQLKLAKEISADFMPSLKIYENRAVLPPAFGVFNAVPTSTDRMLEIMFASDFDPAKEIILAAGEALATTTAATSTVNILSRQAGRWDMVADFSQPGYLFLSQTDLPGWQAEIDGQKTAVRRADYAFAAVKVPAGRHAIVFAYKPWPFNAGKGISLITLFCLIIFAVYYNIFKRQKSESQNLKF